MWMFDQDFLIIKPMHHEILEQNPTEEITHQEAWEALNTLVGYSKIYGLEEWNYTDKQLMIALVKYVKNIRNNI